MGSEFSYHDCRRSRGGRRSGRLTPALHPSGFVLEGVEGRGVCVSAVRARAHVVAEHTEVPDAPDPDEIHAVRHVVVLAPRCPRQLLAALPAARRVLQHGRLREDLDGAVHHGEVRRVRELVAVHDVDLLSDVGPHVIADPPGNQHSIRIHLQGPIIVLETAAGDNLVPDSHEELGVASGAILGGADLDLRDQDRLHCDIILGAQSRVLGRKHVVAVALENACIGIKDGLQQWAFVAARHEEREAIQRGPALHSQAPALRAESVAAPGPVAVVRIRRRVACGLASAPVLVLQVALCSDLLATLRSHAILALLRANLGYPGRHHAGCRRRGIVA
mmetsp:Transcript_23716/g.80190  ORF Transcript_23716/g.80190 Transcript_23716/m.80190 type:complete len:333 (-) Transcript_23716:1011-2009(-)